MLISLTSAGFAPRSAGAAPSAEAVVQTYFTIANGILRGNSTSGLAAVFAPDAVLTAANPKGVVTTVHGIAAITAWYKAWGANALPGTQLTTTSRRNPTPDTVINYEIAGSAAKPLIARCAHIFVIQGGKIVSDDFIVFFVNAA
jgi:ketosteroid isomerase-like protein